METIESISVEEFSNMFDKPNYGESEQIIKICMKEGAARQSFVEEENAKRFRTNLCQTVRKHKLPIRVITQSKIVYANGLWWVGCIKEMME